MRIAPIAVVRALRAHNPDLGLAWSPKGYWFFTHRGQEICAWEHRDGSLAINDLSPDEALRIVQRMDNRRDGGWARLKAASQRVKDRRGRREAEHLVRLEECQRESRAMTECFRRGGPRLMVSSPRSEQHARR